MDKESHENFGNHLKKKTDEFKNKNNLDNYVMIYSTKEGYAGILSNCKKDFHDWAFIAFMKQITKEEIK